MSEVAVIGIGLTPWGKYPDKTTGELAREAIQAALKDANLTWKNIQYVVAGIEPFSGTHGLTAGPNIEATMGYTGIPATSIFNACATGAYLLDVGRSLVMAGLYDTILCVGSFKAPGGFFPATGSAEDENNLDLQRFRLLGQTNPTMFAYGAMRRMYNYGMTEDDIAQIKVKNSKAGRYNPYARYQREYTKEEVMASPMVAYPLRLLEIAATSDGAAAVIISSMKKARELSSKPVQIAAVYGPQPVYPSLNPNPFASQSEASTPAVIPGEMRAHQWYVAQGAYKQAGISPQDLSFAEVYDLSTALELDWMEDIALCKRGEAEKLLRSGDTAIGGKIPINPSGGVASFGESIPAQALLQVCELVTQLRGNAGKRQVANAKVGLAINEGLANSVSCMILKK